MVRPRGCSLSGEMRSTPKVCVPTMVRLHWPSWYTSSVGRFLIRVVWYALRRRDCQKLDMPVLSCKVLQAGLQNLAGHHPACAQKPPAQHALDITGARSWHGWPQLTLDMFGMPWMQG